MVEALQLRLSTTKKKITAIPERNNMTPERPFPSVFVFEPGKSQEGDPVW